MDFVGTGKRLEQGDIGHAARWLGVETAALLAFIEIEAAGRGFDNQNRPKMLFEPHVFWRELGVGKLRDLAAKLGVAYASWGAKPYPKDSYPRLKTAQTVDTVKALRSASWGLGQILADKALICGHSSEEAFVRANMQGEREQLLCMTALMVNWGVPKMLAGKDLTKPESWTGAARKWNGKAFAKHNYHGRIAAAYAKHMAGTPMVVPEPTAPLLIKGMKGEAIRNLQNDLSALGYRFELGVDGRFGDETERHVTAFQTKFGLTPDGKVGGNTQKVIAAALAQEQANGAPAEAPVVFEGQEPKKGGVGPVVAFLSVVLSGLAALAAWFFLR